METKYLERFRKLANEGKSFYQVVGDVLVVERIKEPEKKTAGGLIYGIDTGKKQLGTFEVDKPHWCRVLEVGEGYFDDSSDDTMDKTIPLNVQPGDIILVGQASVKYFSTFGDLHGYEADQIGLTREGEILLRFKGQEGYNGAFRCLNEAAQEQVASSIPPTETL